jgi:hypothetical protein
MVRGSNLRRGKTFFFSPKRPDRVPSLFSSEVKRLGREINHSLLSVADVKNEWSYTFMALGVKPYLFSNLHTMEAV